MSGTRRERAELVADARRLFEQIEEIFADAAAHNRMHPAHPIDPDPDGRLRRAAESLSYQLVTDTGRGPLAPLDPLDDDDEARP